MQASLHSSCNPGLFVMVTLISWTLGEGRQVALVAAFSVAFGLVAPWRHDRHDPSSAAWEPWAVLAMRRTWTATQFVPFLYLALRLNGRAVLALHAAIAWGLWVHGVEVALAALSPLDDLVENHRSAAASHTDTRGALTHSLATPLHTNCNAYACRCRYTLHPSDSLLLKDAH